MGEDTLIFKWIHVSYFELGSKLSYDHLKNLSLNERTFLFLLLTIQNRWQLSGILLSPQ